MEHKIIFFLAVIYCNTVSVYAIAAKKFVWATAIFFKGNTIIVSNPDFANPAAVRYGWKNNPLASLYNKENLSASAFRTDTFDK